MKKKPHVSNDNKGTTIFMHAKKLKFLAMLLQKIILYETERSKNKNLFGRFSVIARVIKQDRKKES